MDSAKRPNSCSPFTPATTLPARLTTSITSAAAAQSGSMEFWERMVPSFAGAKTRNWEKAEEFKRELESEYEVRQNGHRESVAVGPEKVSVKDAVSRFISSKRNENLAESTLSRHVGRRTSRKEEKARTIDWFLLLLPASGLDQNEPCCFIGSYPGRRTSNGLFSEARIRTDH